MSKKEYTTELLKLEDAEIEKMEETEEEIILQIHLKRKAHACPKCETRTEQVHDYHLRSVRDLSIRGKPLKLLYRRRRYICPACGKRFAENCAFLGKYQRFTYQVTDKIIQLLHRTNIIRTRSSKLETGSDYFFSSIMNTSAMEWKREAPLAHSGADIAKDSNVNFLPQELLQ